MASTIFTTIVISALLIAAIADQVNRIKKKKNVAKNRKPFIKKQKRRLAKEKILIDFLKKVSIERDNRNIAWTAPMFYKEIAKKTGLNQSTVSVILRKLVIERKLFKNKSYRFCRYGVKTKGKK